MHCLPVRRNTAVADEVLDGPRSIVQREAYNRCRRRWPCSTDAQPTPSNETNRMIMHRPIRRPTIRALKSAAPYIRMYKGKIFVIKAGGGVFGDPALTPGADRADRDPALLGRARRDGARRRPAAHRADERPRRADADGAGRRVTDEKTIDATSMVLNGLINTRMLAICRELNIEAVGISGVDAGLVRAHRRPPVSRPAAARWWTSASSAKSIRSTPRVHQQASRQRPDAGNQPAVGGRSGTLLNINADTVAAAIGAALPAEKLNLCPGRTRDPRRLRTQAR